MLCRLWAAFPAAAAVGLYKYVAKVNRLVVPFFLPILLYPLYTCTCTCCYSQLTAFLTVLTWTFIQSIRGVQVLVAGESKCTKKMPTCRFPYFPASWRNFGSVLVGTDMEHWLSTYPTRNSSHVDYFNTLLACLFFVLSRKKNSCSHQLTINILPPIPNTGNTNSIFFSYHQFNNHPGKNIFVQVNIKLTGLPCLTSTTKNR